jgi:DNA polymerase-1
MTAKLIFGDEFTKEQRDIAKRINFGIVYGIGPKHFCEVLSQAYPESKYTYTSAKSFIDRYYANYYEVRKFTWNVPRAILERGFVKDVFERTYTCDKATSYKAVNYLIQGCAAGVLKNAMIKVHSLLRNTKSSILLTIHDELVIEIHKDEESLVPQIKKMMEDYKTFRVPITCNIVKTTTSWADKGD